MAAAQPRAKPIKPQLGIDTIVVSEKLFKNPQSCLCPFCDSQQAFVAGALDHHMDTAHPEIRRSKTLKVPLTYMAKLIPKCGLEHPQWRQKKPKDLDKEELVDLEPAYTDEFLQWVRFRNNAVWSHYTARRGCLSAILKHPKTLDPSPCLGPMGECLYGVLRTETTCYANPLRSSSSGGVELAWEERCRLCESVYVRAKRLGFLTASHLTGLSRSTFADDNSARTRTCGMKGCDTPVDTYHYICEAHTLDYVLQEHAKDIKSRQEMSHAVGPAQDVLDYKSLHKFLSYASSTTQGKIPEQWHKIAKEWKENPRNFFFADLEWTNLTDQTVSLCVMKAGEVILSGPVAQEQQQSAHELYLRNADYFSFRALHQAYGKPDEPGMLAPVASAKAVGHAWQSIVGAMEDAGWSQESSYWVEWNFGALSGTDAKHFGDIFPEKMRQGRLQKFLPVVEARIVQPAKLWRLMFPGVPESRLSYVYQMIHPPESPELRKIIHAHDAKADTEMMLAIFKFLVEQPSLADQGTTA